VLVVGPGLSYVWPYRPDQVPSRCASETLRLSEVAGLVEPDDVMWDPRDPLYPLRRARFATLFRRVAMRDLLARLDPAPADEDDEPPASAVAVDATADLPPPPGLAPQVAAALLIAAPAAPPRLLARTTVEASTS